MSDMTVLRTAKHNAWSTSRYVPRIRETWPALYTTKLCRSNVWLGANVANHHGRLLQTYGNGLLYLVHLAATVSYTVGLKLKVCHHIFPLDLLSEIGTHQPLQWIHRGESCDSPRILAVATMEIFPMWRSCVRHSSVLGCPWPLVNSEKTTQIWRIRVSKYAWICHVAIFGWLYTQILDSWNVTLYFPGTKLCMGLLPAFLQTSCDTVCKLPYSTFCNVTDIVLQYWYHT